MIQVINRALDILELLSQNIDRELGLREIAEPLKLNHSTCANIIKTLINRGYIEKGQGYRLGIQSYHLSHNFFDRNNLVMAAVAPMKQLREVVNESCILAILKDNIRVTIHEEISEHELQANTPSEKNAYLTATGRIIIACMDDFKLQQFVQKHGLPEEMWPGVITKADLFETLTEMKKKQLAIQRTDSDIIGVAVPIIQASGSDASLGVYLPASRYQDKEEMIIKYLKSAAQQISFALAQSI